jgi:hypothetical protein
MSVLFYVALSCASRGLVVGHSPTKLSKRIHSELIVNRHRPKGLSHESYYLLLSITVVLTLLLIILSYNFNHSTWFVVLRET